MNFDANTIVYILEILVGGLLVGIGVHFVPVGGAPAAMAQAAGIGTGTVQLAAGSGLTGLLAAGLMMSVTDNLWLILASGAVGAGIMMGSTMLTGSWIYAYAVGAPFASAKVNLRPHNRIFPAALCGSGNGWPGHSHHLLRQRHHRRYVWWSRRRHDLLSALSDQRQRCFERHVRHWYLPGERCDCILEHPGNHRGLPRPQVQEVALRLQSLRHSQHTARFSVSVDHGRCLRCH